MADGNASETVGHGPAAGGTRSGGAVIGAVDGGPGTGYGIVGGFVALAIGLALRACHFVIPGNAEKSWPINLLVSAGAAWWLVDHGAAAGAGATWLPYAVGIGVLVHIVGDALTEGGVPRPFSWFDGKPNRMRGGPLTTGRWYEHVLAGGLVCVTVWLLATNVAGFAVWIDFFTGGGQQMQATK